MGRAPRWSSSRRALGVKFTAPPIVPGSDRISKIWILGTFPVGANLVKASAVVRPAMPPPRMMTWRPSGDAGAMVCLQMCWDVSRIQC